MKMLVLGRGKTGALVAEIARERGHDAVAVGREENRNNHAFAQPWDVAIDFTNPEAALNHISQCASLRRPVVVGTTGWYSHLDAVRAQVAEAKSVLVWGGNFSLGVNFFYEMARIGAAALGYGYAAAITETHHVHKLDAPSGTALALQRILGEAAAITSVREGENMGRHEIRLTSDVDEITLIHQAHSRRGFAMGAVRAAEWAATTRHPGVYEFSDIFRQLT